jgi:predicted N-acetyltransferase YhbS
MTELRPLRPEDVPAVDAMAWASLSDMAAVHEGGPFPARTEEGTTRGRGRFAHLQRTDPDGSWVVVDGGEPVGVALALRRGPMWFLSMLAVATSHQARGIGRQLLEASLRTAEGATAAWILSSPDPKALRRYALAGFAPRPGFLGKGTVDRSLLPAASVVEGEWTRHGDLVDDVATLLRGAPYGPDLEVLSANRLLVVDEPAGRGFAILGGRGRGVRIVSLGATTVDVAQRLLWAALGELGTDEVEVEWLTADQPWAIEVVLAARLSLVPGPSVCVRSAIGPLTPYLPGGAYG